LKIHSFHAHDICVTNFKEIFTNIVERLQGTISSYNNPLQFLWLSISLKFRYLSMKEGCPFVLFIYHVRISQTTMYFATLLISLENLQWIGVQQLGFKIFWPMVEELLNIEHFFTKNSFKSKLKYIVEFVGIFDIFGRPLVSRM